ncbi:MAG: helix-turn-helix domain-containing protein [Flavobacteriales bacterium]|nr:helix-turn-helix domain-containing protein [Flavobacteriales bacterium]
MKHLQLQNYQKHEHFHIISFKDELNSLPPIRAELHSENYFEVTLNRKGGDDILIDGVKYISGGSQLTFLSPGQSLQIDSQQYDKKTEGYLIFFTNEFLNIAPTNFNLIKRFPYFSRNFSPVYALNKEQSNRFFDLMNEIHERFKTPTHDEIEIIKSYLTIILFEAKKIIENAPNKFHSRAEEITYLFENAMRRSKYRLVSDFANELNLSSIYLSECVKKTTGKPAKQIITEYKTWEAKNLLSLTDDSIDGIAEVLGFDDRSNFINFFKKNVGMSPLMFRKRHN